jgi:hypothetical protein
LTFPGVRVACIVLLCAKGAVAGDCKTLRVKGRFGHGVLGSIAIRAPLREPPANRKPPALQEEAYCSSAPEVAGSSKTAWRRNDVQLITCLPTITCLDVWMSRSPDVSPSVGAELLV